MSVLNGAAKCFDQMGDVAKDEIERAAMYLVARSIRNAGAYATAAGHARLHRAEMERRTANATDPE
jgi:hypothetical protein